jgi:hypothetical protein
VWLVALVAGRRVDDVVVDIEQGLTASEARQPACRISRARFSNRTGLL